MSKRRGVTEFLTVFTGDTQIFFDAETDILIALDSNGCFIRVNPAFEKYLGYTESSVLGKPITMIMSPQQPNGNIHLLHYGGGLVTATLIDYRYKVTDNGKRWYLILRPIA